MSAERNTENTRPEAWPEELVLPVLGSDYQERPGLLKTLLPRQSLALVPEPNNEADENAVAVFIWGRPGTGVAKKKPVRIGYIPKAYARIVKRLDSEDRILSVLAHTVGTNDRGVWRCSISVSYEARQDDITKIRKILDSMAVPNIQVAGMIANAADNDQEIRALLTQYEEGCFNA